MCRVKASESAAFPGMHSANLKCPDMIQKKLSMYENKVHAEHVGNHIPVYQKVGGGRLFGGEIMEKHPNVVVHISSLRVNV